jgi:hypothetical protein
MQISDRKGTLVLSPCPRGFVPPDRLRLRVLRGLTVRCGQLRRFDRVGHVADRHARAAETASAVHARPSWPGRSQQFTSSATDHR